MIIGLITPPTEYIANAMEESFSSTKIEIKYGNCPIAILIPAPTKKLPIKTIKRK